MNSVTLTELQGLVNQFDPSSVVIDPIRALQHPQW